MSTDVWHNQNIKIFISSDLNGFNQVIGLICNGSKCYVNMNHKYCTKWEIKK